MTEHAPVWLLAEEWRRRQGRLSAVGKIRNALQPGFQQDVLEASAKNTAVIAPRATGKTWALCSKSAAVSADGGRVAYIGKTEKSLRKYAVPTLKAVCQEHEIPHHELKTEFFTRVGKGEVHFFGADNPFIRDNIRGSRWHLVLVEEAGHFFTNLGSLVREVLQATTFARDGMLMLSGTPNEVPGGLFYDVTRTDDKRMPGWHVVECHDPMYSKYSRNDVEKAMSMYEEQYGPDFRSLPWIQREHYASWSTDLAAMVYKWDQRINSFKRFTPQRDDRRVLSIYSGFRNYENHPEGRTALVETVYNEKRYKCLWVVSAMELSHGYDKIDEIVPLLGEWQKRTKGEIVYDSGHEFVSDAIRDSDGSIRLRPSMEIPGKDGELQAIARLNADLATSRVLVDGGANCEALTKEFLSIGWRRGADGARDNNRMGPDESKPNECAKAAILGWMEARPRKWRARQPKLEDEGKRLIRKMIRNRAKLNQYGCR